MRNITTYNATTIKIRKHHTRFKNYSFNNHTKTGLQTSLLNVSPETIFISGVELFVGKIVDRLLQRTPVILNSKISQNRIHQLRIHLQAYEQISNLVYILIMMSTVLPLLGNCVMLGGAASLSYAFYLRRKQIFYTTLFERIQKAPKFHLDYIDAVKTLPTNKNVTVYGTAKHQSGQEVIARSYIKKKGKDDDRLWNLTLGLQFSLQTGNKELITIKPPEEEYPVLAYNLLKQAEDSKHEERIIAHNQPVCVFGMIEPSGAEGRAVKAEVIMGTKDDQVLIFLDKQIIRLNETAKRTILLGSALFLIHIVYRVSTSEGKEAEQNEVLKGIKAHEAQQQQYSLKR